MKLAVTPSPMVMLSLRIAVAVFSGSLKVNTTSVSTATSVAPLAGDDEDNVGGVTSPPAAVVKLVVLPPNALSSKSVTAVEIATVMVSVDGKSASGVKVTTVSPPPKLKLPATGSLPSVTAKLVVSMVVGSIASSKVATIAALVATSVSPFAGDIELNTGGVTSGPGAGPAATVVKVITSSPTKALPAASVKGVVAPAGLIVTVIVSPAAKSPPPMGPVNVAIEPSWEKVNAPMKLAVTPSPMVMLSLRIAVAVFSGSLKVNTTLVSTATSVAPLAGDDESNVGASVSGPEPAVVKLN